MPTPRIELATYATSYGLGPFHPAIRTRLTIQYWPNVSMATEDEAYEYAARALKDAYDAGNAVAQQWNVYEV